VDKLCNECNSKFHVAGPMWLAPLHDKDYVAEMLKQVKDSPEETYGTRTRMIGMLSVIGEELDDTFFFHIPTLAATLSCQTPPITDLFSAFLNSGYKVSLSHCTTQSVKTNAPQKFVWDVMRSWCVKNPVSEKKKEMPIIKAILSKPVLEIDWTRHIDADPPSKRIKLSRFPDQPPNWGPKARANKKLKEPATVDPRAKKAKLAATELASTTANEEKEQDEMYE